MQGTCRGKVRRCRILEPQSLPSPAQDLLAENGAQRVPALAPCHGIQLSTLKPQFHEGRSVQSARRMRGRGTYRREKTETHDLPPESRRID